MEGKSPLFEGTLSSDALLAQVKGALAQSPEEFQATFSHYFLLRRPKTLLISDGEVDDETAFEYRTASLPVPGDGLHPWQWWTVAVTKQRGLAFPNRLGVGRADSCDIRLRFRFVSKLHARLHLEDGVPTSLEDAGSANGTFVNGQRLSPGQSLPVRSGDRLGFGALTLELLSPAACQVALNARRSLFPSERPSSVPGSGGGR